MLTHDAREGIPSVALDELRQARRFAIGVVDRHTVVLGYWFSATSDSADERFGAVVLPARMEADLPLPRLLARHWQSAWRFVSPDDRVRIIMMDNEARLVVEPARNAFDRSFSKPSTPCVSRHNPRPVNRAPYDAQLSS